MLIERVDNAVRMELILVRLIRRWAAARDAGENRIVSVAELAREMGESPMMAVAVDSVLQLTEGCLGRRLKTESCCGPRLSADEFAVLLMIKSAPDPSGAATVRCPHGLPGALSWAVASLRRLLGGDSALVNRPNSRCPFRIE